MLMPRRIIFLIAVCLLIWSGKVRGADSFHPKEGFVPNRDTAIAVAEAVLTPIYGRDVVQAERPYTAKLEDGVWTVTGSIPKGHVGGASIVRISKADARVLFLIHEK
jgi:hypothetical protein